MTPEEFVSIVRNEVINENQTIYERSLAEESDVSEQVFEQSVLDFYKSLNSKHKEVFVSILRRVSVDTVSSIFAIICGERILEKYRDDFELRYSDGALLNEDLTSIFWELEEDGIA